MENYSYRDGFANNDVDIDSFEKLYKLPPIGGTERQSQYARFIRWEKLGWFVGFPEFVALSKVTDYQWWIDKVYCDFDDFKGKEPICIKCSRYSGGQRYLHRRPAPNKPEPDYVDKVDRWCEANKGKSEAAKFHDYRDYL